MNEKFTLIHRPILINNIVGNVELKRRTTDLISKDAFPSVSLICGGVGRGKSTFAKDICLALQCPNQKNGIPCLECKTCKNLIEKGILQDGNAENVFVLDMSIENKKEYAEELVDLLRLRKPSGYKYTIYRLEEPQNMSVEAQDSLLKTLEYLPPDIKVIFVTSDMHKLRKGIVSRCQPIFEVKSPSTDELIEYLKTICELNDVNCDYSEMELRLLCRAMNNVPRDCLNTLEQVIRTYGRISADDLMACLNILPISNFVRFYKIVNKDPSISIKFVNELMESGIKLSDFLRQLLIFTKDVLKLKSYIDVPYYTTEQKKEITAVFKNFTYKEYIRIYKAVNAINLKDIDLDEDIAEAKIYAFIMSVSTNAMFMPVSVETEVKKSTEQYSKNKQEELSNGKAVDNADEVNRLFANVTECILPPGLDLDMLK